MTTQPANDIEAAVRRIMKEMERWHGIDPALIKTTIRAELSRAPAALPKCLRHGVYMCLACMKGAVPAEPAQQVEVPAVEPVADQVRRRHAPHTRILPRITRKRSEAMTDVQMDLVPQWMPIETAPKDGTLLVLGAKNGVWLGKYRPIYASGFHANNPWSSMLLNHDHMAERYTRPTHWMPLPAAPIHGIGPEQEGLV